MIDCRPDDQEAYESQVQAQKAYLDRDAFNKKWEAERAQQPPQDASDGAQNKVQQFTMIYPDGMDVKGLSYDELFIKLNADDDGFLPVAGVLFLRKGDTSLPEGYEDFKLVRPDDRRKLALALHKKFVAQLQDKEHEERQALAAVQRANREYYELETLAGTMTYHKYKASFDSLDHKCWKVEAELKEARRERIAASHAWRDWWRGYHNYIARLEVSSRG